MQIELENTEDPLQAEPEANENGQPVTVEIKKEWKKLLHQQWLVRNMSYILFLAFLAVIYIYNGHYAETTIKDINKTARELKEMQYEYKTVKGELMMRGKQSELAKAAESTGLKELKSPPIKIVDGDGTSDHDR
jgi:hypothetical protein